MMFLNKHVTIYHDSLSRNRQSGVTLLLSVLILAAISAIAFSLATILLVEIRSSGDLQRTEPALFGTQGILEEAIFEIKRNVTGGSIAQYGCTATSQGTPLNNIVITTSVCSRNPDAVITETIVPAQAVDYGTTKYKYYLIDPDDAYDCVNGGTPACYSSITFNNIGLFGTHSDLSVAICQLDEDDCLTTGWDFERQTLGTSQSVSFTLNPSIPYYAVIVNKSATFGPAKQGFVEITTNGPTGLLLGLPYFGKKVVDVNASYIGLTRRYRAIVPTQ